MQIRQRNLINKAWSRERSNSSISFLAARIRNNSRFHLSLIARVEPPVHSLSASEETTVGDGAYYLLPDVSHNKVAANRRLTSAVRVNWIPHDRLLTSASGLKRGRAFSGFPGSAPELTRIVTSRSRSAPNLSRARQRGESRENGKFINIIECWPLETDCRRGHAEEHE